MEILKNLYRAGTRVGVMLKDGDEVYPIPLECLFDNNIFASLRDSGYELIDVATYEFRKGNDLLSTFPGADEEWVPTDQDEQIFANAELSMDIMPISERYSFVTGANYIKFNNTNDYAINTREEFISYLDSCKKGFHEDDYLPINCFVAPEARFTYEEVTKDFKVIEYMYILANRRKYSQPRFNKLLTFLKRTFNEDITTADRLVDLYLSWGIDGINENAKGSRIASCNSAYEENDPSRFVRVENENNPSNLDPSFRRYINISAHFTKERYMLMGAASAVSLYPGDIDGVIPTYTIADSFRKNPVGPELHAAGNDAYPKRRESTDKYSVEYGEPCYTMERVVVPYNGLVRRWITEEGNEIIITNDIVRFSAGLIFNNIALRDPSDFSKALPSYLWGFEGDKDEVKNVVIFKSLAKSVWAKREVPCDKTSYSILCDLGCSPAAAVRYIASKCGFLNKCLSLDVSDDTWSPDKDYYLSDEDIYSYFKGGCTTEYMRDTFYKSQYSRPVVEGGEYLPTQADYNDDRVTLNNPDVNVKTKEEKAAIIANIVNGSIDLSMGNNMGIMSARESLNNNKIVDRIWQTIYTAHYILGMPIALLREACNSYNGEDVFRLSYNGKSAIIDMPVGDAVQAAAYAEAYTQLAKSTLNHRTFFMIMDVASEYRNSPEADYHVGALGYACDRYDVRTNTDATDVKFDAANRPLDELIDKMTASYEEWFKAKDSRVYTAQESAQIHLKAFEKAEHAILLYGGRGFDYGRNCIVGWPSDDNGNPAYPSDWNDLLKNYASIIQARVHLFVDSLATITDNFVDDLEGDIDWSLHCVNADIFPNKVIPKDSTIIHEIGFRAAFDKQTIVADSGATYSDGKPIPTFLELVKRGHISTNSYYKDPDSDSWFSLSADKRNHIVTIPHRYIVNDKFYNTGRFGGMSSSPVSYYIDTGLMLADAVNPIADIAYYMKYGRASTVDYNNFVAEHSAWYEQMLIDESLANYYYGAKSKQETLHETKWFKAPITPIELLYPSNYYRELDTELDFVSKDITPRHFPVYTGRVLVGPKFMDNTGKFTAMVSYVDRDGHSFSGSFDYPVVKPIKDTRYLLEIKQEKKFDCEVMRGFTIEDITYCDSILTYDFSDKDPIMYFNGYFGAAGKVQPIESFTEDTFAIKWLVLEQLAIFMDPSGRLYRVRLV